MHKITDFSCQEFSLIYKNGLRTDCGNNITLYCDIDIHSNVCVNYSANVTLSDIINCTISLTTFGDHYHTTKATTTNKCDQCTSEPQEFGSELDAVTSNSTTLTTPGVLDNSTTPTTLGVLDNSTTSTALGVLVGLLLVLLVIAITAWGIWTYWSGRGKKINKSR